MIGQDYEKAVVALVCWKHMKSEQYRGMSFLAMMLQNRANAGWFEGSIYNNAIRLAAESDMTFSDVPDAREPQFGALLQMMDGLFTGITPDRTGGALYFAHKSSADLIAGETTAEIGQYIFFRNRQ